MNIAYILIRMQYKHKKIYLLRQRILAQSRILIIGVFLMAFALVLYIPSVRVAFFTVHLNEAKFLVPDRGK